MLVVPVHVCPRKCVARGLLARFSPAHVCGTPLATLITQCADTRPGTREHPSTLTPRCASFIIAGWGLPGSTGSRLRIGGASEQFEQRTRLVELAALRSRFLIRISVLGGGAPLACPWSICCLFRHCAALASEKVIHVGALRNAGSVAERALVAMPASATLAAKAPLTAQPAVLANVWVLS